MIKMGLEIEIKGFVCKYLEIIFSFRYKEGLVCGFVVLVKLFWVYMWFLVLCFRVYL